MDVRESIWKLAERHLGDSSHFVVAVVVGTRREPVKLTVVVDGDKGLSIDDCATLSRKLSAGIEEEGILAGDFRLEVSSPGLDQPLQLKRQYYKNVGRRLKVTTTDERVEGKLVGVDDEAISLEKETGTRKAPETVRQRIPFEKIQKAHVQIAFK